jgi:hypothetical protein
MTPFWKYKNCRLQKSILILFISKPVHMKKVFSLVSSLLLPLLILAEDTAANKKQSNKPVRYNLGIIPAINFDADLGFRYGAVINFFDYGIPNSKPKYKQYLQTRLINSTGGTLLAQALLESNTILKRKWVIAEASYLVDTRMDFFGFNGRQAVYQPSFIQSYSELFIHKDFYTHKRNKLRLRFDVQHQLGQSPWRLLTGLSLNRYIIKDHHFTAVHDASQMQSLFTNYKNWGLIKSDEAEGGTISLVSLGLIYDTRNENCYCTNGTWFEGLLFYAPKSISSQTFSKLVLTYRQHKSFYNDKITLSVRASSQQKISGQIPFYMLPTYFDSRLNQDGPGGAFNLRGAFRNRIAVNGFLASNIELKWRSADIYLLRQYFFVGLSAFYDNAYITQTYKINLNGVPNEFRSAFFNDKKEQYYHTFGPGLYIVFNRNNVITVNYGITLNEQDGRGGLYIGSSLLF